VHLRALRRGELPRTRVLVGLGILIFLLAAIVVAVVSRSSREGPVRPIRIGAGLTPRTPLFGDTVTARVEFAADTRKVVPGSVRVEGQFAPFRKVARALVEREGAGDTEYVVWTARLRCLGKTCLPKGSERRVSFPPVRVTYTPAGAEPAVAKTVSVRWPALIVYSRVDPIEVDATDPRDQPPWRANLESLLAVSFAVPPRISAAALYGAGGVFLLGAVALVAPLRRREAEPEPLEEVPPPVPETPFERALAALEQEARGDGGVGDRRRTLEFVAAELGRREQGDLEASARRLAWSQRTPSVEDAAALARTARKATRKERA
jgi:hypothetical protein